MGTYHCPYMILNGIEYLGEPMAMVNADYEARRFKEEYHPEEAGVKCFEQDIINIISWKTGEYGYQHGKLLYIQKI